MARILISIGSNVERGKHIRASVDALKQEFADVTLSSVYESVAVGFDGAPFYNLAVAAHTTQSIADVVRVLKQIEDSNGRVRKCAKFSSRTLDLDLLTYDDEVAQAPVELPRDEITKNAFVLWPLAELVPNEIHPTVQKSYQTLWQLFDKDKQTLHAIDSDWR